MADIVHMLLVRYHGPGRPRTLPSPPPGRRLEVDGWRIEAALAEMARDGCLSAWTLRSWEQRIGGDAPPARELQTHRVDARLMHALSGRALARAA